MQFSFILLAFLPLLIDTLVSTDEIQDADSAQSGYLDNHNLHPAVVSSPGFGILWKNNYDPAHQEAWYARPLIYHPPGASQLVFTASNKNILRTLDAVNGTLLNARVVQPPFLSSDLGCGDIPNFVGVTVSVSLQVCKELVKDSDSNYRERRLLIRTPILLISFPKDT